MDAPSAVLDLVFPPEHCDFELGEAYKDRGYSGVYELKQARLKASGEEFSAVNLRYDVAEMFGVSPGDLMPWLVD